MKLDPIITFRNMEPSAALETTIREKVAKLDEFSSEIMSCRVMVEAEHRHRHQGNLYHVRVDLTVPGKEIVAKRTPTEHQSYEDIYVAVRDAFDATRRQLEDYARKRRREVKAHEAPAHGKIIEVIPAEDYGRIVTPDGRNIFFHRNSLVNGDFNDLAEGMEVSFAEEMGEEGPQASSVHLLGKHHYT